MFPGETILTGAKTVCDECNSGLTFRVLCSSGGYYVGTQCCGIPYTRETEYFDTDQEAHAALWGMTDALTNHTQLPGFVRK